VPPQPEAFGKQSVETVAESNSLEFVEDGGLEVEFEDRIGK